MILPSPKPFRILTACAWTLSVIAMITLPLSPLLAQTGGSNGSKSGQSSLPDAGTAGLCAYRGSIVPCEVLPTVLVDKLETKLKAEMYRTDQAIDIATKADRKAAERLGQLNYCKSELGAARANLKPRLPDWITWAGVGLAFVLGAAGGVYVGVKLAP